MLRHLLSQVLEGDKEIGPKLIGLAISLIIGIIVAVNIIAEVAD